MTAGTVAQPLRSDETGWRSYVLPEAVAVSDWLEQRSYGAVRMGEDGIVYADHAIAVLLLPGRRLEDLCRIFRFATVTEKELLVFSRAGFSNRIERWARRRRVALFVLTGSDGVDPVGEVARSLTTEPRDLP